MLLRSKLLLLFSLQVVPNSLWPHGLQHSRLFCPSPFPRFCSNSCSLNWWCYPISIYLFRLSYLQVCPYILPTKVVSQHTSSPLKRERRRTQQFAAISLNQLTNKIINFPEFCKPVIKQSFWEKLNYINIQKNKFC